MTTRFRGRSGPPRPTPEALYLLPFDHRASYEAGLFHWSDPLEAAESAELSASKGVIYDGFLRALDEGVPRGRAGILVDERFGSDILRDAAHQGVFTAVPVERSAQPEFDFEFDDQFRMHIEAFDPTFAKALVRYNPEGDAAVNRRQEARLRHLCDYLRLNGRGFMFELLVPATQRQRDSVRGNRDAYDDLLRPALMVSAIKGLQAAGVEPDIWKVEGLERREDDARIVAAARRDGRGHVGCIVLGRGADDARVVHWLRMAAAVPGFIGFAVGRSTFWDAIMEWLRDDSARDAAVARIAARYHRWVDVFEQAREASAKTQP